MAGQAAAVFGAIFDLIPTLDPDVQVLYATRASQMQQDVVGVTGIQTETTRPTLGNSHRSREEAHTVTVVASCFRPGPDASTQRTVVEKAFALIDTLAEHLRDGDGPTLGLGARIDAWVSSTELDVFADDDELQLKGRAAAVTAQLTVNAYRT